MASKTRTETKVHIVHCSATTRRQDIGRRTIHKEHLKQGIYSDSGMTGYHVIVRRSGVVELCRSLDLWGQHCIGWNDKSIGTCLVGGARKAEGREEQDWDGLVAENNLMFSQTEALAAWHRALLTIHPNLLLVPHSAITGRVCPSFDVWAWQQEEFGYNDRLRFAEYKAALDAGADEREEDD